LLYFVTFYPVNQEFCESCGDTYATSADTLLSNGAFIMTDYQPAANSFKLVKNPNYYDASRISLDGIDYQILKDSQQALMSYQNGDLDIIILSGDQIDQVQEDPDYQSYGAGYLWYLCPNITGSKEMENKNFRLAITNAINRESLVSEVTKDGSVPAYAMVPSGLSYSSEGEDFTSHSDTYSSVCSDDLAKATVYFNKAKAELGENTMEIKFLVDDTALQQNIAVVIKAQLEKALPGLTVNLTVEPKKQRIADSFAGDFDLVMT
jgi:oligopeptide transport system substrate-binding protein